MILTIIHHFFFLLLQTAYRQCIQENNLTLPSLDTNNTELSGGETESGNDTVVCLPPRSYVPENVLPHLWRVLYWTSQFLTWYTLVMNHTRIVFLNNS